MILETLGDMFNDIWKVNHDNRRQRNDYRVEDIMQIVRNFCVRLFVLVADDETLESCFQTVLDTYRRGNR